MIRINKRNTVSANLKDYCMYAKDEHEMEVTEWSNGEGYDINIIGNKDQQFSLTHGELQCLLVLGNYQHER